MDCRICFNFLSKTEFRCSNPSQIYCNAKHSRVRYNIQSHFLFIKNLAVQKQVKKLCWKVFNFHLKSFYTDYWKTRYLLSQKGISIPTPVSLSNPSLLSLSQKPETSEIVSTFSFFCSASEQFWKMALCSSGTLFRRMVGEQILKGLRIADCGLC